MDRRRFIRNLSGGVLLLSNPMVWASPANHLTSAQKESMRYVTETERKVSVWKETDVLVIGGSSGAVAAAVAAAKLGSKVTLISSMPYLGEDICGSFLYWNNDASKSTSTLAQTIFPSGVPPFPLEVKSCLENRLIDHRVDFLYSSFPTELLIDSDGSPSGVIISNRSGRQAIVAKIVLDATHYGVAARLAGAQTQPADGSRVQFLYTVIGDGKPKQAPEIKSAEVIFPAFNLPSKSLQAVRYTFEFDLNDDSYDSLMLLENRMRDITWDVDQTDSSDLPFYVPSVSFRCDEKFKPQGTTNIYVLSGRVDMPRNEALALMQPVRLMETGEQLGAVLHREAGGRTVRYPVTTKGGGKAECFPTNRVDERLVALRPLLTPATHLALLSSSLPVIEEVDVLVIGGGTAGAGAGISAARHGARTLMVEYLHGLGGVGTFGYIGRYTSGYRKGFSGEVDQAMNDIAPANHPRRKGLSDTEWIVDWKARFYHREYLKAGGRVWYNCIGCGAITSVGNGSKEKRIEGVVIITPYGRTVVKAKCVIDATGSADIAIAAGAAYEYVDGRSVAVQGSGLPKFNPGDHYNNSDWLFTEDADMLDVTRSFIQVKQKCRGNYDIGKLPQTRERRRVVADYMVSVYDMIMNRTYDDTFSFHRSNFDTHGFTTDPYFNLNLLSSNHRVYEVKMPLRALLPKGMEGVIVTGLGAGVHRDAMPVVRMQADLQNQGYAAGYLASVVAKEGCPLRKVDIRAVQQHLVKVGTLPAGVESENEFAPFTDKQLKEAVERVKSSRDGLEIILTEPLRSIAPLRAALRKAVNDGERLRLSSILCALGEKEPWKIIADRLLSIDSWNTTPYSQLAQFAPEKLGEKDTTIWNSGWDYRGMGQFGSSLSALDALIISLGSTGRSEGLTAIHRLADMLTADDALSHIQAIAIACETIASPLSAPHLYRILRLDGMQGHWIATYRDARQKVEPNFIDAVYHQENHVRNRALKEIHLARALYRCGDKEGLGKRILTHYAGGLEGHYAIHAQAVLEI